MTRFAASRDEFIASLRAYTGFLEERNNTLERIACAGADIKTALEADMVEPVDTLLDKREVECRRLHEVGLKRPGDADAVIEAAHKLAARDTEISGLTVHADKLTATSEDIARRILECQSECEQIMKQRISATSRALRESKQRTRLDAAYGPARTHDTPVFLDRQR